MKKLRIGLVGAGNIANSHLDAYKKLDNVEIVAACDINESRLNETCDIFGIEKRYTSETGIFEVTGFTDILTIE